MVVADHNWAVVACIAGVVEEAPVDIDLAEVDSPEEDTAVGFGSSCIAEDCFACYKLVLLLLLYYSLDRNIHQLRRRGRVDCKPSFE